MKLFNHQKTIVEHLTANSSFAIFAEQGTGKTLPMLYHITNLLRSGDIKNALIVCPLYVVASWERDILKLPTHRQKLCDSIKVINYDKVWRREEYSEGWDLVVLDEAHNICNRTSKRTQWAIGTKTKRNRKIGINEKSKYRYILTGTPLDKGKLEQFYCLMDFLVPNFFGTYKEFSARYLVERQIPGTFVNFIVGYRNKEEILEKVARYSYRVLKKDCLDLPEKLDPEVIECENKEKKMYKEAEESYIMDLLMNFDNPLVKIAKLRQITSGFIIDEDGEIHELKCQKYKILENMLEDFSSKVVIFANFKYSVAKIEAMLDKKKIKYVTLNGNTKDKKIWKRFQEEDDIKVFIGQYQSAREGIDLFASNKVIFFEPCQDTRTLHQAMDRCHRIGQTEPVSYYHLITKGTIEEVLYSRLEKGENLNSQYLRKVIERGGFDYE